MLKVEFNRNDVVRVNIDDIGNFNDIDEISTVYIESGKIYVLKKLKNYVMGETELEYKWILINRLDRRKFPTYSYYSYEQALKDKKENEIYIGNNLQELLVDLFDKGIITK
jgi:hypothetical protein